MTASRYNPPAPDPQARLRELQESTEISPEIAELRLAELRGEVPDAVVQIDSVRADDIAIAVRVTIGLPRGARNSVIAAADVDDQSGWAEQMEQVQAVAIARALDGLPSTPGRQQQSQTRSQQQQPQPQAPTQSSGEGDHLPEYSWNAFWQTMNSRNITRDQVQQALGKSVQEATPKEAVEALKSAGLMK